MAFNVGDTAGDYEIVGILGTGGMGKVYKARNVISDRIEAMKVLLPNLEQEPELADRFIREIKLLGSLNHPNIASLHTAMRLENQLLMVMEYVEGRTLEDRLHDGPLPVAEAVDYISQVLSALAYAHERGVVHRDIKPANMMVTSAGQVKLMDFGIAKAVADRRLTMTGTTLGSLFYMSPEQVKGSSEIDGRSDLYSLGVSLYEIVTGMRPFKGDSDYSIMVAHLEKQPVPPIQVQPGLPPALNEIILTAIEKDPAKRFQSAQAFRAALESVRAQAGLPPARDAMAPPLRPAAPPPPVAPPQPIPPPLATIQAPATAPHSSHRGLYMALGALVAVAVLVIAAIQLPRFLRTRAGSTTPAAQESVTPAPQPAAPTPSPETPAAPPQTPEPAAQAPAQPATEVKPGPVLSAPVRSRRLSSQPRDVSPAPASVPVQTPVPDQPQQAQAAPPQPATPDTAALEQQQDRLGMIGSRANALRSTLQNLEQQQRAAGVGLRIDISTSWKRMETLLDTAEAALKSGDSARAKRNLDQAETEMDKLDRFLGH